MFRNCNDTFLGQRGLRVEAQRLVVPRQLLLKSWMPPNPKEEIGQGGSSIHKGRRETQAAAEGYFRQKAQEEVKA